MCIETSDLHESVQDKSTCKPRKPHPEASPPLSKKERKSPNIKSTTNFIYTFPPPFANKKKFQISSPQRIPFIASRALKDSHTHTHPEKETSPKANPPLTAYPSHLPTASTHHNPKSPSNPAHEFISIRVSAGAPLHHKCEQGKKNTRGISCIQQNRRISVEAHIRETRSSAAHPRTHPSIPAPKRHQTTTQHTHHAQAKHNQKSRTYAFHL